MLVNFWCFTLRSIIFVLKFSLWALHKKEKSHNPNEHLWELLLWEEVGIFSKSIIKDIHDSLVNRVLGASLLRFSKCHWLAIETCSRLRYMLVFRCLSAAESNDEKACRYQLWTLWESPPFSFLPSYVCGYLYLNKNLNCQLLKKSQIAVDLCFLPSWICFSHHHILYLLQLLFNSAHLIPLI